jgi:hypothetical protein
MGVKPPNEHGFMETVVRAAELRGWLVFHDADSRKNPAGLPDLVLVRNGTLVLAELKAPKGRLRAAQERWLERLRAVEGRAGGAVRVFVWRPADWPAIVEALGGE